MSSALVGRWWARALSGLVMLLVDCSVIAITKQALLRVITASDSWDGLPFVVVRPITSLIRSSLRKTKWNNGVRGVDDLRDVIVDDVSTGCGKSDNAGRGTCVVSFPGSSSSSSIGYGWMEMGGGGRDGEVAEDDVLTTLRENNSFCVAGAVARSRWQTSNVPYLYVQAPFNLRPSQSPVTSRPRACVCVCDVNARLSRKKTPAS